MATTDLLRNKVAETPTMNQAITEPVGIPLIFDVKSLEMPMCRAFRQ